MDLVVERENASGRRRLGRLVQLGLKFSDLVFGAVSHQAFIGLSLRCKHLMRRGSFPRARLCCPEPPAVLPPHTPPPRRRASSFGLGDTLRPPRLPLRRRQGPPPGVPFPPSPLPLPPPWFFPTLTSPPPPSLVSAKGKGARASLFFSGLGVGGGGLLFRLKVGVGRVLREVCGWWAAGASFPPAPQAGSGPEGSYTTEAG